MTNVINILFRTYFSSYPPPPFPSNNHREAHSSHCIDPIGVKHYKQQQQQQNKPELNFSTLPEMSSLERSISNKESPFLFAPLDPQNIMNDYPVDHIRQQQQQLSSTPILHNEIFNYVSNQSQDSLNLDDYNYCYPYSNNDDISSQISLNDYFPTNTESSADQVNDEITISNVFTPYGNPNSFTTQNIPLLEESRSKSTSSFRLRSNEDFLNNDILMIEQDSFDVYGKAAQNELITINESKDWQDLNFVKADDIMYEFSDDEDDDDDWESNKLDDSMDLDETESHGSLRDEDHNANDYIDEEDIYSPNNGSYSSPASEIDDTNKLPNVINPADLEKEPQLIINQFDDFKPEFQIKQIKYDLLPPPPPPVILPSQNGMLSSDDSIIMMHDCHHSEEEDEEDYEEEDDEDEIPIPKFNTLERRDSDLYEKVLHDRSYSSDSTTSIQQKPKSKKVKKEIAKPKEIKEEDHFCLINNPKTGKPCNKRFSRPYDLVRHQNTIHATKRSFYRCLFCEDDLRRKNNLDPINDIVKDADYRKSNFSSENAQTQVTSSTIIKKLKNGPDAGQEYMSNKTFSRCDALTRHLRFRHGLGNKHVILALDFAKNNVEFYDN